MKKFLSIFIVLLFIFAFSTNYVKAAAIADVAYGETNSVVHTSPIAGDTLVTFTETTALVGGDYIVLTFPTGTVLNTSNILFSDFTIQEGTGAATSPSVIAANADARQIVLYIHAASLEDGMGVFTIKLSGTAGGDEIVNPTAITTTGTFTVATYAAGVAADSGSDADVTFTHDVANKYTIINPTDGTVDAAINVTVQLQDQYGNIITTGGDKDKDVTLVADGAATGEGLVNIANGTGTLALTDHTAETVNLSLTDSETTGFAVTSTQNVVFAPGATTNIIVSSEPTIGYTYQSFGTQPIVRIRDQYNNIATADGSAISIEAYTADNFAGTKSEFTGTSTVYATDNGLVGGTADGVSTFSGIKYNTINTTGIYLCAWVDTNADGVKDGGETVTDCSSLFKIYANASDQVVISSSTSGTTTTTVPATQAVTTTTTAPATQTTTTTTFEGKMPVASKAINLMTQAEKNDYTMQLQQFLIQLLTQLLTLLKK